MRKYLARLVKQRMHPEFLWEHLEDSRFGDQKEDGSIKLRWDK
jgi:hypothetical protein